jgi:glucose/arabinose dehydrogenase
MLSSRSTLLSTVVLAASVIGCSEPADTAADTGRATDTNGADCASVETRAANAPNQRPAFQGQTRACAITSDTASFTVDVVAGGLVHPWSVEPLPDSGFLVTEKPGRMRHISASGTVGPAITGVPPVVARDQGGLLDIALSPSFATDRTIFWSYSEPRQGGNATSVARGVLSADNRSLSQVNVIFRSLPVYDNGYHFGSRLAFAPDGKLLVTIGERSDTPMRKHAQQLDGHLGKTVRINADGSVPDDNPFAGRDGARPEIWTLGHRNAQAAAFDSDGKYWVIEHGTRGGDELNLVEKGKNYGWPVQAYGIEYGGDAISGSATTREGMEQPVYYWDPVIAPSGAQFYTGDAFPNWRNSLFIGSLGQRRLVRLTLDGNRVSGEEHLLIGRSKRLRDVRQGPDGALYIVTDEQNGELWRVRPRS